MSAIKSDMFTQPYPSVGPRSEFVACVCVLGCVFCQKTPVLVEHSVVVELSEGEVVAFPPDYHS